MTIWDTPCDGAVHSPAVGSGLALDGADVLLFVFDARNRDTFVAVINAVAEVKLRCSEDGTAVPEVVLAANFSDQVKKCKFQKEVDAFAKKNRAEARNISARSSDGITTVMHCLERVVESKAGGGRGAERMER